jgi:hypothetical protein
MKKGNSREGGSLHRPGPVQTLKPDLRELVGVACTSAHLESHEGREGAIERVGALAYAQHATGERLSALLWRAKYSRDAIAARSAARALTKLLAGEGLMAADEALVFSSRLIAEWIADKCAACGGTGLQEILAGRRIRPRGIGIGYGHLAACLACHGSRRARPDHKARAQLFGLAMRAYFDARWPDRFLRGRRFLDLAARQLTYPLRSALRGDSVPACDPADSHTSEHHGLAEALRSSIESPVESDGERVPSETEPVS